MTRIAIAGIIGLIASHVGIASAGPTVVTGGPPGGGRAFAASLDRTAGLLGVCWRGKRPANVRVRIDVGKTGRVQSAKAVTRGKVATCAAAVLAVQTLANTGRAYAATVEFSTRGGATASATVRDAVARGVQSNPALRACYEGVKGVRGELHVRFVVRPTGETGSVEAVGSTVSPASVETCIVRAIGGVSLGTLTTARSVEFTLPFSFDGAGASASPGGALQPQKRGPIRNDVLDRVMKPATPKFTACYDRQARADPGLAGDVVIRFTIRADGTTRNVKVKRTTLTNAKVETCMVAVGKQLRFPAKPGRKDTKVIYPFRFAQQR